MEFSVDHSKYYRGYGKNRKNTREKKVDMYPKKSKCVQRMRDRDNKHAMLDITNNYNLPQKMTRNCQYLKYFRHNHYKNIEDYFDYLYYLMIMELQMGIRERIEEEENMFEEEDYIFQHSHSNNTNTSRKRSYSFDSETDDEISYDLSENITCPNCGHKF